ncbi:MAG: ribosomal protein S18-alanine N-acetyltransferase [Candidatus Nezhaarchaeota archaeon]|nr:ribosomal protein S18-alanine N-acetyltransferase [Candidatus Nezhaarchaeota archaeon]
MKTKQDAVTIIIRRALPSDFPQIVDVELSSFERPYPPRLLSLLLHLHRDTFYVALANKEVVGYVVGAKRSDKCGHVISIAVRSEWRRRGIGSKLMITLLNTFKKKGLKRAFLEVAVSNEGAIVFYKRLGFEVVSLLRNYYPWGEDAYLMVKEL